jgi:hypothetical protein
MSDDTNNLSTERIKEWKSIVTLLVFIITSKRCKQLIQRYSLHSLISSLDLIVLFPFHIPIYVPRPVSIAFFKALRSSRIIPPKQKAHFAVDVDVEQDVEVKNIVVLQFPMNFVTAPLVADLFLLAIGAIGRQDVSLLSSSVIPYLR